MDEHSRQYRAYPWERLASLSAREVELSNRAARWVPGARESKWSSAFESFWSDLIGIPHQIECLGFSSYEAGRLARPAGDLFVTEFDFPVSHAPGLIAVDSSLAESWLDVVVGPAANARRVVDYDDRDAGVLTYLGIRAADFLTSRGAPPASVATRRIPPDAAFERISRSASVMEVDFVFTHERATGFVRIYVPEPMMTIFDEWAKRPFEVAAPVAEVTVVALASVGYSLLTEPEVKSLQPGDVVLAVQSALSGDDGALVVAGNALATKVGVTHANTTFEVVADLGGEMMMEEDRAKPDEVTGRMLQAVDLRADFVIGNVTMSVADLARMQPGRVFTVDRSVGEPVDVVVRDKVVAKGELVDVEGKVGVRIVSIAGR